MTPRPSPATRQTTNLACLIRTTVGVRGPEAKSLGPSPASLPVLVIPCHRAYIPVTVMAAVPAKAKLEGVPLAGIKGSR